MSDWSRAHYPLPWQVAWRALLSRGPVPGAWRADAVACCARVRPPIVMGGTERLPAAGGYVLTANHYASRRVASWWLPLAVSAAVPADVRWVTTSALWYAGGPRAWVVTPVTRWFLARVARVYGFTTMPPMPPKPSETAARAAAVREVLRWVRHTRGAVVGLAPEGGDGGPASELHAPPPGAGRFVGLLEAAGLAIVPVGVFEASGALHVTIGASYRLADEVSGPGATGADQAAAEVIMGHIAALLPAALRGPYAPIERNGA